jgi:hypothetical protein
LSKCSSPAPTSWPTRTARNSPTLGTSKIYVSSTLRKDFQVSFVIYIPNTPVGDTNVKFHRINKVKGQLGFPSKTKSPSRATMGGAPTPKKMASFFRKIRCKRAKYASTQILGESTRDTSSQRAKQARVKDSPRLQQDTPLPPRRFAYKLLMQAKLSQPKIHLRKREGRRTQLLK